MKITRLVLSGYKRLLLNNIHCLTLEPESIYQLILGTNGSGKSSVLYELSPLPAQTNNYAKGGFKKIDIEKGNDRYNLSSIFKSGNKHSFVKNGEELNPGGTGAVQKELVEQEFGLTQDLHELLIGDTHFTNLSPAKRREWITRLCHIDFSYALGVHQKLKSSARDAQGALKHTKQRISNESNKLLAIGDLEELETRYQTLHKELEILFNERNPNALQVHEGERHLESLLAEIERLSTLLVEKVPTIPDGFSFDSLQGVDEYLSEIKTEQQVNESLRSRISTEYEELNQLLEGFRDAGVEDFSAIKQQIVELKQSRYETMRRVETRHELDIDPVEAQRSFFEAATPLVNVLNALPANPDRHFTKEKIRKAKEQFPDVKHQLEKTRNRLAHYESQHEHLLSLQKQECPECGYRWVPGRSDAEKAKLEETIGKGKGKCSELEGRVNAISEYLQQADDYSQQFYGFRQLTHEYPKLRDLWDALLKDGRLAEEPQALVGVVHDFGRDLEHHVTAQGITERLERLEKLLESPSEGKQVSGVVERLEGLSKQIEELTKTLEGLKVTEQQMGRYRQHVKVYLEKVEDLENRLEEMEGLRDDLVEAYRNDGINTVVREHQTQLASLQQRRTEKQTLEGIIRDLELDQQSLEGDHDLLAQLAAELSPTDGLIAEQLTGFIESFVGHVNQVIDQIWTYELRVQPCGLESGDLDYKFPLYVKHEGKDNTAPDIAKGSEAQVEVVNLAFRLVTMVYLGLSEYPVYLDEAGRSFDEQHRVNLLSFIKQLVDTGNYTQLFIVSHYAAQFGTFTNSDILVLDDSNVTIPKKHNTHATLE